MPEYAEHMRNAIEAARGAHPHPNPRVGAIVLDQAGTVVGAGIHHGPGSAHAEVDALDSAGDRAQGGTLIVTLEPCNHHGRTPPCVEAILASGIRRVVIGAVDPDTRVAGAGVERLRNSGVEVGAGVLAAEVEAMDPGYFHHRRTGRPRVTLKAALTLDGQVAARDGSSQWITSPEARADAHRLRAEADAVMIGAGTALLDNPQLSVRLPGYRGHQPTPVVVAGRRTLPRDLGVFRRNPTVFAPAELDVRGDVVVMESGELVDLEKALVILGDRGIVDLLVEGGPTLAAALLEAGLVDRGVFYVGSKIAGGSGRAPFEGVFAGIGDAVTVEVEAVRRVGPDVRIDFVFRPGGEG